MTSGKKLWTVVLVAIVTLQVFAMVPASSLAKTTSGGNAPVSDAGIAPGIHISDATIDDDTISEIEVAYNATGVLSKDDILLEVMGPNDFYARTDSGEHPFNFASNITDTKGVVKLIIPPKSFGGGDLTLDVVLDNRSSSSHPSSVDSDESSLEVTSAVDLDDYSLSASEVAIGENVTVNATLVNTDPDSDHNYTLSLFDVFGDGMKAENESRQVTVNKSETEYVTFNRSYSTSGLRELSINEQPPMPVTVTNPVEFVNYTLSDRTVGVDEDVWVNATLHNPSSSPAPYQLFFTAVDEVDGNWKSDTTPNHTLVEPGYETVSFKTNFSSTGARFTFLDSTSDGLADPKVFVVNDSSGTPEISYAEVNEPRRAVVDEPTMFVARLENTGDATGVENVTLETDGNTTSEHFMVEAGQSRFAFLEYTYEDKGDYTATFGGETFHVNVTDPVVVDSSVEHVDGPLDTGQMPTLDTQMTPFGMVSLYLTDQSGSQDLSSIGATGDTTFRVNLSLQNYEPRVLVSSGAELDWERASDAGKGSTNVSILVNPARLDHKQTDATVDDWDQKVQNDRADFGMDAAVLTSVSDGTHPFFDTDPSALSGMTISTDAQLFRPPVYEPPAPGESPKLRIRLAGPHETVDGSINDGYYRAFLPDALLDEWDVDSTDDLDVSYSADPSATYDVTEVPGGMDVNLTMHYSAGTAVISADAVEESDDSSSSTARSPSISYSSTPDISVVDAAVDATDIEVGSSVQVEAVLENDGSGDGTHEVALVVDDSVVDRADVTVAAGDSETVSFTRTFDDPGSYEISLSETRAGTVVVEDVSTPAPTATPTPSETATPGQTETATATATPDPTATPSITATPEETADTGATPDPAEQTTSPATTETTGQPGFGIAAALVALVAAGLFARRRGR